MSFIKGHRKGMRSGDDGDATESDGGAGLGEERCKRRRERK